jgi:hypothetical protein
MTQAIFSFREVYVVTEVAAAEDCSMAISGYGLGELELATDHQNFGLVDVFGHSPSKTIQSKDIEYNNRVEGGRPSLHKAKRLTVQNEKLEVFIGDLINHLTGINQWVNDFYSYNFDTESDDSEGEYL